MGKEVNVDGYGECNDDHGDIPEAPCVHLFSKCVSGAICVEPSFRNRELVSVGAAGTDDLVCVDWSHVRSQRKRRTYSMGGDVS